MFSIPDDFHEEGAGRLKSLRFSVDGSADAHVVGRREDALRP